MFLLLFLVKSHLFSRRIPEIKNDLAANYLLLDLSVVPVKGVSRDMSTYCLIYLKYLRFYNFFRLSYILMNGTLQLF